MSLAPTNPLGDESAKTQFIYYLSSNTLLMRQLLFCALALFVTTFQFSLKVSAQVNSFWSLAGNSNASDSTSKLGTTNGINLRLFTNNVERLRVLSSNGNVGIGTFTPVARLHINSPSRITPMRIQIASSTKFLVGTNGGLTIGAGFTPPPAGLYVQGNVGLGVKEPLVKLQIAGGKSETTVLHIDQGNVVVTNNDIVPEEYRAMYSNTRYGTAIYGVSGEHTGVRGYSFLGVGIEGFGPIGVKGIGNSQYRKGVVGIAIQDGIAVEGRNEGSSGYGGVFSGTVGLRATGASFTYAAEFLGKVYASNGFVTSDGNLKENILEIENAISIIGKLKPYHYEFKKEIKYQFLHLPEGKHYGLIAQDVEEVLPNLVSTANHEELKDEDVLGKQKRQFITIKAVNYVELIPIMVKAMQEQSAENKSLKEQLADQQIQITELRQMILDLKNGNSRAITSIGAFLEQNSPNPVNRSTLIRYSIPEHTSNAHLSVTNVKGQLIKTVTISNKGLGQLNLDTSTLASGIYTYTLYVDGQFADSKQLIVTR
jgi:hypothetical protein